MRGRGSSQNVLRLQEGPELCPPALAQASGLRPGHPGPGGLYGLASDSICSPLCSWGFTVVHETEKHEKQQW